jgi:hypothetical protein
MSIPFRIRFLNNSNDKHSDDVLTIKKVDDGFLWSFRDSHEKHAQTTVLSQPYAVVERVQTMLSLFAVDSAPAKEVQVDTPGFPTVLFKASEVSANIGLVRNALYQVLDAWPEWDRHCSRHTSHDDMPPLVPAPTRRNTHLYFD